MKTIPKLSYKILLVLFFVVYSCQSQVKKAVLKDTQPNIIYIYVDQLSANMMSCAGNEYLNTPAMDYIAKNGIRFTRAYTTNPVCSPARVSMITGRFPSYFKDNAGVEVRENKGSMHIPTVSQEVTNATLSSYLKKSNYELYFGGKEHLPESLTPKALGFNKFSDNERGELVEKASEIINQKHKKPYFMVVSIINPHDICYMALRQEATSEKDAKLLKNASVELETLDAAMKIPEGVTEEAFYANYCPPLPKNYEPQIDEPKAVLSLINRRPFRKNAREHFTDNDWKHHRYAYHRLTEVMDQKVQILLDAIKESGEEENTLIIFSSDHGDMSASHRMEHKSTLYEESANIPFMAMWKGQIPKGQVNDVDLVSNGLDFLPTVCDYAGIQGVSDARGKSLRPLFEGKQVTWRETLGVESEIGKMVVDKSGLKYIRYDVDGIEEQLLNLKEDPFETNHFTNNLIYKEELERLRHVYNTEWFYEKSSEEILKTGSKEKGFTLVNIKNGDWIQFANVTFNKKYQKIIANISFDGKKGTLEIRTKSPKGKCIGKIKLSPENQLKTFQKIESKINNSIEVTDIYLVFKTEKGSLLKLDWVKFE